MPENGSHLLFASGLYERLVTKYQWHKLLIQLKVELDGIAKLKRNYLQFLNIFSLLFQSCCLSYKIAFYFDFSLDF